MSPKYRDGGGESAREGTSGAEIKTQGNKKAREETWEAHGFETSFKYFWEKSI